MPSGPQIAVVGEAGKEILEQGERSSVSADEAQRLFVELECEYCGHVGTYPGRLVSEANQRFHSNHTEACHNCDQPLEATVNLREDPTEGGLNVEGFEEPQGASYNHDPYLADKIEDAPS